MITIDAILHTWHLIFDNILERIEERKYILTISPESDEKDNEPVLLGRGYIDKRNFKAVDD